MKSFLKFYIILISLLFIGIFFVAKNASAIITPIFTVGSIAEQGANLLAGSTTNLYNFNVSADTEGPVALSQLKFFVDISRVGPQLFNFELFRDSDSTNLASAGLVTIKNSFGYSVMTGGVFLISHDEIIVTFDPEEIIPAGASYSYTLKAVPSYFQANDSVATNILVDNLPLNSITMVAQSFQPCNINNGAGKKIWNGSAWGDCIIESCNTNYHQDSNSCMSNSRSCNISNGNGNQVWDDNVWGDCTWVGCNSGYHQSGNTCAVDSTTTTTTTTTATTSTSLGGGSGGSGGGSAGGGGGGTTAIATSTTTAKVGDINTDGFVNEYDFAIMMAEWGKPGLNPADLNKDGMTNEYDFALLMLYWEK